MAPTEPLPDGDPLWDTPNLTLTPHSSGNPDGTRCTYALCTDCHLDLDLDLCLDKGILGSVLFVCVLLLRFLRLARRAGTVGNGPRYDAAVVRFLQQRHSRRR